MPPVFARAPALTIEGLLDYTRSEHVKMYKSGIRSISNNAFDCDAEGLFQFLKDVRDRADEMGWTEGVLRITIDGGGENERKENFIDNYGTITLEQVITSELQYIN
jgi:hypothetical protein